MVAKGEGEGWTGDPGLIDANYCLWNGQATRSCCIALGTITCCFWWSMMKANMRKRMCICICNWVTLLYSRKMTDHCKPSMIEKNENHLKKRNKKNLNLVNWKSKKNKRKKSPTPQVLLRDYLGKRGKGYLPVRDLSSLFRNDCLDHEGLSIRLVLLVIWAINLWSPSPSGSNPSEVCVLVVSILLPPNGSFSVCKTAQMVWLRILSTAFEEELKGLDFV